ncbi:MAG: RDD family protein [Blastocatellia bacterium]|nr:RDD family protein [Blastocatellia bacterium]
MNCPRCQQEVSPKSKFCRRCGATLSAAPSATGETGDSPHQSTRILGSPPSPAVSPPGGVRPLGNPPPAPARPDGGLSGPAVPATIPPAVAPTADRPPPPPPPIPNLSTDKPSGEWKRTSDVSLVPPPALAPRSRRSTGNLQLVEEPEMLSVRPEDFSLAPPTNVLIGPYQQAGFGLRFGAALFDFSLYLLWFLVWLPIAAFAANRVPVLADVCRLLGTYGLGLVFALNWLVLPARSGQTIGKWLVGIRIVQTNFGKVNWPTILKRHLLGYPLSTLFLFGFVWVLWDRRQQSWHDKLARTLVVRVDL